MDSTLKKERIQNLIAAMERLRRAQKSMRHEHAHEGPIFPLIEFAQICGDEAVPTSRLAEVFGISPAAATQFINRLTFFGYVTREHNPDDRRQVMVKLSEKGSRKAAAAQSEFMDNMSGLLDYLGEEDASKLNAIIEKVAEYFNQGKTENHEQEKQA
ncbi:MAG: MarR family transcriptional regulator [Erysipelotrichales bacterium]|nr:MAG: MarR family transcriptional regulator [Erysipelotrichales bacterium]